MTEQPQPAAPPAPDSQAAKADDDPGPVQRFFGTLKSVFGDSGNGDTTLRESLEDVIEQHDPAREGFSPEERVMLLNILEFGKLRVDDVMVPRADIVAVDQSAPIGELLNLFKSAGHSRLPVYRGSLDDPVGMVHIKDVVGWITSVAARKTRARKPARVAVKPQAEDASAAAAQAEPAAGAGTGKRRAARSQAKQESAAASAVAGLDLGKVDLSVLLSEARIRREVLFVPPSMLAVDLLLKMQSTRIHMAVVVDEYGGTDGLVSIEDLVEEIVGEIEDEHDDTEAPMVVATDAGYDVDARMAIDDLEELLGIELVSPDREEDVDTLGGLVFSMVGRVPIRGELIRHPGGVEFEVLEGDPRRLRKLRIHLSPHRPSRAADAAPAAAPKAAAPESEELPDAGGAAPPGPATSDKTSPPQ